MFSGRRNQMNCELHVFVTGFFFSVKSKPPKTSFHLFGETTGGSLNAPSVGREGNLSPSTVSCLCGRDFTAWATWQRADFFWGDEGSNGPEMKNNIWPQLQVHFCQWTFVPDQNGLNKDVSVSTSVTFFDTQSDFFPRFFFLTRAPNLSLSPWESGNKWQLFSLSLRRLDFLPGHQEKGSSVFLIAK